MLFQSRLRTAIKRTALVLVFTFVCGSQIFAADNPNLRGTDRASSLENQPGELLTQQKPTPTPSASPSVAMSPATDNTSQSHQGRQYGQPGFVGEPINLNVVNADIRDILNYITEQ